MSDYWLLFASAFGAATVLPFYSEVVLLGLLATGRDPLWIWVYATAGNTLGAVVNWYIGWHIDALAGRRWFPVSERQLARGRDWFNRYGYWSLLLAWLPVGGDALTFVGGAMRVRLPLFLALVGSGKGLRYGVLIMAVTA